MIIDRQHEIPITTQTDNYTIALSDLDSLIELNSSTSKALFIPTNANVAFNVGSQISVIQIGTGTFTIEAVTPGTTTIQSNGSTSTAPILRGQYSAATLIKAAVDRWYVVGDIS